MKLFRNSTYDFEGLKDVTHTAATLAIECLNNPPEKGFDLNTIDERLKVRAKLEAHMEDDVIDLEDAEAVTLQRCVKSMNWLFLHEDISDFGKMIEGMEAKGKKKK